MENSSPLPDRKHHRLSALVYAKTEYEFFFTICARQHGAPFREVALADEVINSLLWTKNRYGWLLYCYCLMPDHLHFMCRLTKQDLEPVSHGARGAQPLGVLDHIARFKSYTTQLSWSHGIEGALWQRSSYDRVLDMEQPFVEIAEYVLNNPVRRELAKTWEEWKYSRVVDPWW